SIGLIYSPWGQQSGAHLNPVITLTFFRLGKIEPWDCAFYFVAQFAGALVGILVLALLLDPAIAHPAVNYVATVPGWGGSGIAFLVEALISFGLMLVVLLSTNHSRLARFTGLLTGALWALYVVVAAPLSGPSTNPALTLASAVPSQLWMPLWVY